MCRVSSGGERLRDKRGVNELKRRDSKERRRTGKGKGKSEKKKRIVLRRLEHRDAKEEERREKNSSETMLLFQGQVKYSQSYLFD
jgi:hypothetical protein